MNEFDVIESPLHGTNLIEASAGTGKTYAISIIYLRLIVENSFRIEDILVVTFTIPATMELRLRIRDRLRDAVSVIEGADVGDKTVSLLMDKYKNDTVMKQRLLTALKSFDQASVYTIHSFCQQMLVDNAFESGSLFTSEIVNDDALIEQGIADLCRRTLYNSNPALVSYFMANCSVKELLDLYKKRPLSPDLRIEPEPSKGGLELLEKCSSLVSLYYNELSEKWSGSEESISEILNRKNFLNQKSYKEESNDEIIENMNNYIAGENPFAVFKKFDNFTSDKIKKSLTKGNEYHESEIFEICQKLFTAYREYTDSGSSLLSGIKRELFDVIDELVLKSKSLNNRRTFDDLIKDAQRGLNSLSGKILAEKVRGRYLAALIDEFQDTDNLQFDIFSSLFNNDKSILFLIGDPKQAIYRFRGADIFSYIKASKLMKNRYTLARNWRSRVELIDSVNEVFMRCKNPFIFDKIQFYPVRPGEETQGEQFMKSGEPLPPLDIWLAGEESTSGNNLLLDKLSAEISLLINRDKDNPYSVGDKKIKSGDIAVLVRTKQQGKDVRDVFARYNIPSVSRGMDNVFKTQEASDLYFIVSAIYEPSSYNHMKAAASTVVLGGSAGVLYSYRQDSSGISNSLDDITSRFYDYREIWTAGGFLNMITDFLEKESVPSRLFALNGGERMITNINQIIEILHSAEHLNGFTPREIVAWFGRTMASPPDKDEYYMRLERDDDAVNIITMHACKGLEFPVVYCPFLAHTVDDKDNYVIYHDPDDDNRVVLHLDKNITKEVKAIKKDEDLAENVRLLYVALTRAKSRCCVMFALNKYFSRSAAHYIFVKEPGFGTLKFSRDVLVSALNDLAEKSEGKISFDEGSVSKGRIYIAEKHSAEEITVRQFTGELKKSWKTHSYSSIVKQFQSHDKNIENKEKDFLLEYHSGYEKGEGIFGFASGPRAGLCIHEIFEKIDFTEQDRVCVTEKCGEILEKYRYDVSSKSDLADMFFNVVNSTLDSDTGLKLSDIGEGSRLSELEFNFPMDYFNSIKFRDLFKEGNIYSDKIYNGLASDHSEPGGMMKGFIDLIFEYNGKYYIADWKSNHLGNSSADYLIDSITTEMEKHNYFLQYYIYSAALHRYLKQRLGNSYSYMDHFGGVYYFFVRGMNPDIKGGPGIFRDIPLMSVVEKLDHYFTGENK